MVDDRRGGSSEDRDALDDLERFRQGIERERARRRLVSDEFDAFIRAFKQPSAPRVTSPPPAPPSSEPFQSPSGTAAEPPPARPVGPPPSMEPPPVRVDDLLSALDAEPAPPRRRPGLIVLALAVLVVGAVLAWTLWPGDQPASPPVAVSDTVPASPQPTAQAASPSTVAPSQPAAPEAPTQPPPAPAVTELTTTRNVWVRVIVDGERVLERELPAGSRIPLEPKETIVIRTGDAGAVQLTIAGQDQGTLGREGQVVTRTFSVKEKL